MWRWYDGVWGGRHGRFDCALLWGGGGGGSRKENTASKYGVKYGVKPPRTNLRGFTPYFHAVFFGDVDDVT
jgi:hypothetical protein